MSEILRLRSLALTPAAQGEYAASLMKPRQRRDILLAALHALVKAPTPTGREPILQTYAHFSADGRKRDPGAFMRRAALDALRSVALPADVPLLLQATNTYEFLPPGFKEDAILLRAGALLILNELDDTLAGYQATRLLVDGYSNPMSGEPALTAVRVLASQAQTLPLYLYALQANDAALPEVISECLRSLTAAPAALIPGIIARHGQSESSIVRIGLCDLLIAHEAGPHGLDYLADALVSLHDLDAYRYLVIALLTARRPALTALVSHAARLETRANRIAALAEALGIFSADPEIASLGEELRKSG